MKGNTLCPVSEWRLAQRQRNPTDKLSELSSSIWYQTIIYKKILEVVHLCCNYILNIFWKRCFFKKKRTKHIFNCRDLQIWFCPLKIVISSIHYITLFTTPFFVVSTHWVGYVHNIFKLYTAPYKQTKKDRLLKKAPLEVRHNEGWSFLSASGFLCLLHTPVTLLLGIRLGASRWRETKSL